MCAHSSVRFGAGRVGHIRHSNENRSRVLFRSSMRGKRRPGRMFRVVVSRRTHVCEIPSQRQWSVLLNTCTSLMLQCENLQVDKQLHL
jgi:hypothetical protein